MILSLPSPWVHAYMFYGCVSQVYPRIQELLSLLISNTNRCSPYPTLLQGEESNNTLSSLQQSRIRTPKNAQCFTNFILLQKWPRPGQ